MSIAQNYPAISPSLLLDFANVEALDPRITFTRATTATYYGTRTALAEQNLLLQSQTFDNASWAKANVTATANTTTAPDGTTTADTITENTATAAHLVQSGAVPYVRNTTFTISVYAKPNGKTQFLLGMTSGGGGQADFLIDLTAFTATFNFNNAGVTSFSGTATNVGSGWCRATITFTTPDSSAGDSGTAVFWLGNSKSYTGDGTSGLFFWGAQLEQRSSVTAYTVTTTQPITNYIPVLETAASGVARFDHNPTTFESLGLLIEEQRTNLFTYSEQFDNAFWTKSNASVTINTVVAPDSTLSADKLFENSTLNQHAIFNFSTTVAAGSHTFSVFAKAGERNWIKLGINSTSGVIGAFFNLSTGAVGTVESGVTQTITPVGNNWYRCTVTATASAGASGGANVYLATGNNTLSYTGDGYSGIYIWGAQLEATAFSTSYIATVASQVTRAADAASMTGTNFSSWFNQAEGTLYVDTKNIGNASTAKFVAGISDGSANNYIGISSDKYRAAVQSVLVVDLSYTLDIDNFRVAIVYKTNDYAVSKDGNAVLTDTLATVPVVNQLCIGDLETSNNRRVNGHIKKLAYYPIRLSNTNLVALTG